MLPASVCTTSRLPRFTSTSVTSARRRWRAPRSPSRCACPFFSAISDQIFGQHLSLGQHRGGYGSSSSWASAGSRRWLPVDRCKPPGEFDARLCFDARDEMREYVSKTPTCSLLSREGATRKVGNPPHVSTRLSRDPLWTACSSSSITDCSRSWLVSPAKPTNSPLHLGACGAAGGWLRRVGNQPWEAISNR